MVAADAVAGKDRILVTFDKRVLPASLVATDYQSGLSLLEVAPCCGKPVLISDRQACAGQMVVALGSAYGMRAAPSLGFCAGVRQDGTMQFSAPIASGAVGGGVFDLSGRLLGIITGGIGTDRRIALALPAHRIPEIVDHLLTSGDRYAGFIGISVREIEISPATPVPHPGRLATASGKSDQILQRGVVVTSVRAGSPAHQAGLMPGDLVFSVDDIPVNSAAGLERMVLQSPPGRALQIELLRQDRYYAVSVVVDRKQLGRQPAMKRRISSDDGFRKIDSLKRTLQQIKDEILHLEQRLYRLD
jgi:S1-C subfamily serine protease